MSRFKVILELCNVRWMNAKRKTKFKTFENVR